MNVFRDHFKRSVVITGAIAGLLIVIANSAVWANRYLFDNNNFTSTAVSSLTSQSSRTALATEIVDTALKDYPRIKSIVDDTAINFVSGLLGSARTEQITTKVVSKLQVFLTSPKRSPVVINLESAKDAVTKLIQISGREDEARIDPEKVPDQITLFNPDNYPNFYQASVTLTWLSPVMALGALALLAWPYVRHRSDYKELLVVQGLCVAVFGLLALLVGPLFKPIALGSIDSPNMRVVVGNLYNAFVTTFNQQTMVIVVFGLGAALVGGVLIIRDRRRKKKK